MSFFARILCFPVFFALSAMLAGCSSANLDKFGLGVFNGEAETGPAGSTAAAGPVAPVATAQPASGTAADDAAVQTLVPSPVYIVGEVEYPGEFPFAEGLTVPQLVLLAGGYSHRADPDRALVMRKGVDAKMFMDLSNPIPLQPGDIIQIPQKYF